MSPELRHLRYFAAVAEELSFTTAARRLFISQQALSRNVRQLERELGVELFERTTRSVKLTSAGKAMLPAALRAAAAADEAARSAQRAAHGDRSLRLRIDVSSASLKTGALILERLRSDHPDVAIEEHEVGVTRGLELMQRGQLDAMLGLARPAQGVVADLVRREPILVGMAASHPFSKLAAVPVKALDGLDLLLPSDEAAVEWNELVFAFCRQAGAEPRRMSGSTHGSVSAARVLRQRRCVVLTTAWTEPLPGLAFRPLVDPPPTFTWSLMTAESTADREPVAALKRCARMLSLESGWTEGAPVEGTAREAPRAAGEAPGSSRPR